jgi:hypothetical protein
MLHYWKSLRALYAAILTVLVGEDHVTTSISWAHNPLEREKGPVHPYSTLIYEGEAAILMLLMIVIGMIGVNHIETRQKNPPHTHPLSYKPLKTKKKQNKKIAFSIVVDLFCCTSYLYILIFHHVSEPFYFLRLYYGKRGKVQRDGDAVGRF